MARAGLAILILLLAAAPALAQDYSLRADAQRAGVLLGVASQSTYLGDKPYVELVKRHAGAITFENETKWSFVHPERDRYDFAGADALARFALVSGLKMRGHVLIWHAQNPDWLKQLSPTRVEALALLKEHIDTVVGHFRDQFPGLVVEWDVVNEGIDNDGTRRQNVWQRWIGDDYMDHAFRMAHAAAGPGVKLYYNDYLDGGMVEGAEAIGGDFDDGDPYPMATPGATGSMDCDAVVKCRAVKELVSGLVARGVPIDGVGFQAHVANPTPSDYRGLTAWVGKLGLRWAVTELDVPVPPNGGEQSRSHQANAYRLTASACLDDPACSTIVTWGITDRYSWWPTLTNGALGEALHFDRDLRPKPAADALHTLLTAAPATGPGGCPRKTTLVVKVPRRRGERVRSVRVSVEGGRTRRFRGNRTRVRVPFPAGRDRVRVRIAVRVLASGRLKTRRVTRRYSACR